MGRKETDHAQKLGLFPIRHSDSDEVRQAIPDIPSLSLILIFDVCHTIRARHGRPHGQTLQDPRPHRKRPGIRHHADVYQVGMRQIVHSVLAGCVYVHGRNELCPSRDSDGALDVRLHERGLRLDA